VCFVVALEGEHSHSGHLPAPGGHQLLVFQLANVDAFHAVVFVEKRPES